MNALKAIPHTPHCRITSYKGILLLHTYVAQDLVFKNSVFLLCIFLKLKSVSLVISIFLLVISIFAIFQLEKNFLAPFCKLNTHFNTIDTVTHFESNYTLSSPGHGKMLFQITFFILHNHSFPEL